MTVINGCIFYFLQAIQMSRAFESDYFPKLFRYFNTKNICLANIIC